MSHSICAAMGHMCILVPVCHFHLRVEVLDVTRSNRELRMMEMPLLIKALDRTVT